MRKEMVFVFFDRGVSEKVEQNNVIELKSLFFFYDKSLNSIKFPSFILFHPPYVFPPLLFKKFICIKPSPRKLSNITHAEEF